MNTQVQGPTINLDRPFGRVRSTVLPRLPPSRSRSTHNETHRKKSRRPLQHYFSNKAAASKHLLEHQKYRLERAVFLRSPRRSELPSRSLWRRYRCPFLTWLPDSDLLLASPYPRAFMRVRQHSTHIGIFLVLYKTTVVAPLITAVGIRPLEECRRHFCPH